MVLFPLLSNILYFSPTMSRVRADDSSPTMETQQRLNKAIDPYIIEWTNSLAESEVDLVDCLPGSEATAIFIIWLLERVTLYSTRWKEQWQRRQVAEAAVREVEKDLEEMGRKFKEAEGRLQVLKLALDQIARKEQISKKQKDDGFLKRVAGNMRWEHGSNRSSTDG